MRPSKESIDQVRLHAIAGTVSSLLLAEIDSLSKTIEEMNELVIGAKCNCRINLAHEEKSTPHVRAASNQLGEANAIARKALRI